MGTYTKHILPLIVLLAGVQACGSGPSNPVKVALAEHRRPAGGGAAVAFRFAAERGGDARLYVVPGLNEATWRFRTPGLLVQRVIGFSRDQDEVYLLSVKRELTGLDLTTGRARVIDTSVVAATMSPTGVLHLVRADGSLAAIDYRAATPWPDTLDALPEALWGGPDRLVALLPQPRRLVALTATKPPLAQEIPDGPVAMSPWGEMAIVAVDSGLIVLDPADSARWAFARLSGKPTAVAFSPSGHRIYVARGDKLLALERVSLDVAERGSLPGPATALRADPLGRVLLARPAAGDSIWLMDPTRMTLLGTLPGAWRDDLPTVAPDGSVLVARGTDLVAYGSGSLTTQGTVVAGAVDHWLIATWDPRRPELQIASDTAASPSRAVAGQEIYVQVSSTANEAWAQASARDLRAAGMQASVLPPSPDEDRFRVVLGPYPTRDAAEAIGRKLGRPFWIFTREGQEPPQ